MTNVHIITQGCAANQADSEVMAGLLSQEYALVDSPEQAEVVVFNTCTVKGPTESYFRKKLKELEAAGKKIVLAGCLVQGSTSRKQFSQFSLVGTTQLDKIGEAVNATVRGTPAEYLERRTTPLLNVPRLRSNPFVEIVPVSQGCLSACTYCKTKHARGALVSTPPVDIVRHISKAIEEGAREVWLTSQDMSAYGLDRETNMPQLLRQILTIPRHFKLRVGMANPLFIHDFIDELIEVFKHPNIYKFIHIPVQSGSNKVLSDMKRGYTVDDFLTIAKRFRKEIPDITVATDIIVGFPTETREDFEATVRMVEEVRPDVFNLSKFWPREGTPAAKMKQIDGTEMKRRTVLMSNLLFSLTESNNKKWIGKKGKALVTEQSRQGTFVGRNYAYKPIIIESTENLMGKEIDVEIVSSTRIDLRGMVVFERTEKEAPIFS